MLYDVICSCQRC